VIIITFIVDVIGEVIVQVIGDDDGNDDIGGGEGHFVNLQFTTLS